MYQSLRKNRFKIDLNNKDFMFEDSEGVSLFSKYSNWDKLIKKIISI
jgi:hypothetical protein